MKLMVDTSSSSREELPSAATPWPCPCPLDEHIPPHCKWRMGPSKQALEPSKVTRPFQPTGRFVGGTRKATRRHGHPTPRVLWDAQRRAGVAIPQEWGLLGGFLQNS